ncbi:MAG: hypothetical protein EA396_00390 [Anaerolineaceae bacterium]|nr:MAG: hypothetical protein EA396_00390 [Anaerolineaceae bacterium]
MVTPPPTPAGNAAGWTISELTLILLRQFKRLLAEREVALTDAQMREIAEAVAERRPLPSPAPDIRAALVDVVGGSVARLREWDLTFAASLRTEMTDLTALWQTTADFLDVANEKVNAEIRIGAGSALLALLGDADHADYLLQAIEHDLRVHGDLDVDAVIARRALLHAANIPPEHDDWLEQARAWAGGR